MASKAVCVLRGDGIQGTIWFNQAVKFHSHFLCNTNTITTYVE